VTYTVTYTGADSVALATGDITLNKTSTATGTVSVSGSGNAQRIVTISSITGDGTLGITIAAGTASDLAGNTAGAAGPSATFTVDNTPPAVSIGSPSATLTGSGPVTYTVTYTGADSVTLAPSDITLNKTGTATGTVSVSGSGNTQRIVTISSITGDGTLGITIAAGTASDLAGNTAGAAGPSVTFTVDNTPPTVAISAPSATLTRSGPVTYTVTYTGADSVALATGDITLNKTGTADGTVAVSGSGNAQRIVTISSITGDGTLGITIAAGTASDLAGNTAGAAGPTVTFTVDNTPPTVQSISLIGTPPANAGTVDFLVTFSESVALVDASDFIVSTSGSITTPPTITSVSGSGNTRIVTVDTGAMEGALGLTVADIDHSILDAAGNPLSGDGSSGLVHPTDTILPRIVSIAPVNPGYWQTPSGPTNDPSVNFQVTFNQGIGVFNLAAVSVSGAGSGVAEAPVDSGDHVIWNVAVSGIDGDGDLAITVQSGADVQDLVGNNLAASATSSPAVQIDNTPPMPIITGDHTLTNTTRTLTIDFSETVDSFELSDITVSNGIAGNLLPSGPASTYTVDVLGSGEATVSVSISAGKATDRAGNPNNATGSAFTFPFDGIAPTAAITRDNPTPTTANTVAFSVDFSENVGTSFTAAAVSLTPGSLDGAINVSGTDPDYTVTVTLAAPDADGAVGIMVSGAGITDPAGNAYAGGSSPLYTIHNWHGFTTEPADASLYTGDTYTLGVDADFGPITPTYQWQWDDGAGPIQAGRTTPVWEIANVTSANQGGYWCEVTYDGVSHLSRTATLEVEDHLQIVAPPEGAVKHLGESYTFSVLVTGGYPPLSYVWKKDGKTIPSATDSSCDLSSLTESDSGVYTIEVADSNIDTRSASARLTVISEDMPVASLAGLAALCAIIALGGIRAGRRQ
jgi:hypothetical protein